MEHYMITRLPLTEDQKNQREINRVVRLNAKFDTEHLDMPEGFSVGYIGNCSRDLDDRSWMIFRDHAGRVGTREDTIGGYSTEERYKLLTAISTIKFALNV
jgi:hypothetical protein